MEFLTTLFVITALVVGATFCIVLINGVPFQKRDENAPVSFRGRKFAFEKICVGVSTLVFGVSWILAWYYFILFENGLLRSLGAFFSSHILLHSLSGTALLLTSVAIFRKWGNVKKWMVVSMGLVFLSVIVTLSAFTDATAMTQTLMTVFAVWTFCVGFLLSTSVFMLDYITHERGKHLPHLP